MAAEAKEAERLDKLAGWPAPEEQDAWFGDRSAETVLLDAFRGGRMHHAWLFGGPKGIGKATLAYRFARFVLAHPDPKTVEVAAATDLAVGAEHPAFRRVAGRAHPNLLALERPYREDRKRYLTELPVDEIRRTVSFFGSTVGEAGWRIAIVDPADDMNASAANALLKILEEPPTRSLFLIVSHAPGRILPTIRSRCRRLALAPLPADAIREAIRSRPSASPVDDEELDLAAELSEGSLRRAVQLLAENGIDTYRQFARLAAGFPAMDIPAMHAFADAIAARGEDDAYDGFLDMLRAWLDRRVRGDGEPGGTPLPAAIAAAPLARWAEVWDKATQSADLAETLNLDRKQVVLNILMTLAHAIRM